MVSVLLVNFWNRMTGILTLQQYSEIFTFHTSFEIKTNQDSGDMYARAIGHVSTNGEVIA